MNMMKKCIIYGAGRHAELQVITLEKDGYDIIALCDSDPAKCGGVFGEKYRIISKEEAIKLCKDDCSVEVVIGVTDTRLHKEISEIVKSEFPKSTTVIFSESKIKNRVQNAELEDYYKSMEYKWEVDLNGLFNNWVDNLDTEVDFWLYNGLDKKSESSGRYRDLRRMKRNDVMFEERDLEKYVKNGDIMLDIGCALVSWFGQKIPDGYIKIIPIDALAYYYNTMNARDEKAIEETYHCNFGTFEIISNLFGAEFADIIYIRNSMDHSFDPYRGLIKCLYTLKTGGVMKLSHQRAEAVHENWVGLHNWNFDCIDNDFVIWNKDNAVNISKELSRHADITVRYEEKENRDDQWVDVLIRKKKAFDLSEYIDVKQENDIMAGFVSKLFERMASDGMRFQTGLNEVEVNS